MTEYFEFDVKKEVFSEEGIERALEFLRVAKKDFEASKLLMKHDLYPQALFMIQQSLEKIAKAILLALGLASIEDLKREVGHKVLMGGIKLLLSTVTDKFMYSITYRLMDKPMQFVTFFCMCSNALQHFDDLIRDSSKAVKRLKRLVDKETMKGVEKLTEIGRKSLERANDEVLKEIDSIVDKYSSYLIDPPSLVKDVGIENTYLRLKDLLDSLCTCVKQKVKNRNQRTILLRGLKEHFKRFKDEIVRIMYLMDVYLYTIMYHALFEANVSKLRYPEEGWTPTNISSDSILVIESRKIIDTFDKVELFSIVENFIRGQIKTKRSREIYNSLSQLFNKMSET
ncbi:MAG: hypothetical protein DRJ59_07980 [Thermoprotei archaeon]|nr:MAG: hypothetical protein DRJ59_07980 [Thermoprotei archaeon]